MVALTAPAPQAQIEITRWAISVVDYHRLHDAGILGKDDRVELIDGEVRLMTPIGTFHAAIVKRFIALLITCLFKIGNDGIQLP